MGNSTSRIASRPSGKQSSNSFDIALSIARQSTALNPFGFLCITTSSMIFSRFSSFVFSFFTLFGFLYVAKLSTFVSNVDWGCTILPCFAFNFNSRCTITSHAHMFSPFKLPILTMLNLASTLSRKFILLDNVLVGQNIPTNP